jgi:3,4-dihydroxy 2-butanone 4-phosphate synthase
MVGKEVVTMFTGRIQEIAQIVSVADERIVVRAPKSAGRIQVGGSLNVAGVCVTVEHIAGAAVTATVSAETRRRTTFDDCAPGRRVNLEPALAIGDPLDGHLVQGHVDAVGKVAGIDGQGAARRVWIRPPARFLPRVAAKGSIAVDGVSLAVAEVVRDRFSVVLIPATLEQTTLGGLAAGDRVNLESDLVARLAARPAVAGADVARAFSSLGWAGHISGRTGAEKAVAQLAAGGAVMVWDPDREVEGDVIFAGAAIPDRDRDDQADEERGPPLAGADGTRVESPTPVVRRLVGRSGGRLAAVRSPAARGCRRATRESQRPYRAGR